MDGDAVAIDFDVARETAMHTIVAEEMRVGLCAAKIVDRYRNKIVSPAFYKRAQSQPADTSETVDTDFDGHATIPSIFPISISTSLNNHLSVMQH